MPERGVNPKRLKQRTQDPLAGWTFSDVQQSHIIRRLRAAAISVAKSKPHIAIVDDDVSVSRSIKRLLRSLGIEAQIFNSGREFIDSFDEPRSIKPNCVILDVRMPDLNGLQVQEQLALIDCRIPIIFITADNDPSDRERALAAGAVAFLRKPFNADLFIDTLREALRRRANA